MLRIRTGFLLGLGLLGYLSVASANDVVFQNVQDQTVLFGVGSGSTQTAPKPVKTGLFELEYVGVLHPGDGSMPYFLFTGLPCKSCSAEKALYLIRPGATQPLVTSFVQPGKIFEPRSRALVMESRAFFGHCLPGEEGDQVYVVYQKERVDRRHRLQTSVYVAQASPDFIRERLIERHLPNINRTLALVRKKQCHEVETRNRLMVLHPHGLNWRDLQPSDADDDSDGPRTDVE